MNEKFSCSVAAYLKNARYTGKSKKTLANYEKRLRLYGLFCADNDLREDDFRTVSAWRDSMLDAGMKPSSVSQYLNELKIFFTAVSNPIFGSDLCYPENPVSPEFFPKVAKRPLRSNPDRRAGGQADPEPKNDRCQVWHVAPELRDLRPAPDEQDQKLRASGPDPFRSGFPKRRADGFAREGR